MTLLNERPSIYEYCIFATIYLTALHFCEGFTICRPSFVVHSRLSIYAPPGSGYATPEDEESELPDTYEPMMEYPGTMRPGRTPENMPFHDLPIGDDEELPIPWPHFQQIEWHHRWPPPHPHPIPMEMFIEMNGRWSSPEDEADMRAMTRKNVLDRREMEEEERKSTLIIDDEEEDDDDNEIPIELGEGVFGALGSGSEQAVTTAAVTEETSNVGKSSTTEESQEDDFEDFLLDLGLDAGGTDDIVIEDDTQPPTSEGQDDGTSNLLDAMTNMLGEESEAGDSGDDLDLGLGLLDIPEEGSIDITMDSDNEDIDDASAVAAISEDEDLDIGLDDDEDLSGDGMTMVPLEDFGDDSLMDDEDVFDDGGFDYDGGGDSDGGDGW